MSKNRVYIVTYDHGKLHRLVRAGTPAQAIRHVVSNNYHAEVASQEALIGLLGSGIKVEDAAEPSTESVPPKGEAEPS